MGEIPKSPPDSLTVSENDIQSEVWNGGFREDKTKARKPDAFHPWYHRGLFLAEFGRMDQPSIPEEVIEVALGDSVIDQKHIPKEDVVVSEIQAYTVSDILQKADHEINFSGKVLVNRLLKEAGADLSDRTAIPLSQSQLNDIVRRINKLHNL